MANQSYFNSAVARTKLATTVLPRWLRSKTRKLNTELIYQRWAGFVNVASNIVVLGGVVFSIYQFLAYQHEERVKFTFQFVEKFDDERFLDARRTVSQALQSYEQKIARLNQARMSADAEKKLRGRLAQFLVNDSNDNKGIVRELNLLIGFFNGLQICIEKNLCDRPVAIAFFNSHADSIWANFGPYVEQRRKAVKNYGLGLELFLRPE